MIPKTFWVIIFIYLFLFLNKNLFYYFQIHVFIEGKYSFRRWVLSNKLRLTTDLICGDERHRNESFSDKTEAQKITEYIKCYDILSINCYKLYNFSLYKLWVHQGRRELDFQKIMISSHNLGNIESVRKILIHF